MRPERRRIVAVEAHRRLAGRCPRVIHALGTGESFRVQEMPDGFLDEASGTRVVAEPARLVPAGGEAIAFALDGDVGFAGYDPEARQRFTGRAGAGASITLYPAGGGAFFQYAVMDWEE